jgi:hypothetical protein
LKRAWIDLVEYAVPPPQFVALTHFRKSFPDIALPGVTPHPLTGSSRRIPKANPA